MRSVLYTLQRLKDQEKKEKQRELAVAENARQEKYDTLSRLQQELSNERANRPLTAGEVALQDRLLMHQFYAVCRAEEDVAVHNENVQACQEALLFARQQSKINEQLVETMEAEIALERKRKQDKETDELGVMGWWRNQGLME